MEDAQVEQAGKEKDRSKTSKSIGDGTAQKEKNYAPYWFEDGK